MQDRTADERREDTQGNSLFPYDQARAGAVATLQWKKAINLNFSSFPLLIFHGKNILKIEF